MKLSSIGIVLMGASLAFYGCAGEETKTESGSTGAAADSSEKAAAPAPPKAAPTVQAPAGSELDVVLIDALSTATAKAGDGFTASLESPLVVGGKTALAKGTVLHGKVVDAEGAQRVKGKARISLALTSATVGGKNVPIVTHTFSQEAASQKGKDIGIIGGAAGAGAVVGGILGGKSGAAKGAAIGGGAGGATVLATKGKEVEFGAETKLKFTLEQAATFPAS